MRKIVEEGNAPTFMDVYRRIQVMTKTRTQGELAKILGICQSNVAEAKRRDRIPPSWYIKLFEKFGLSQDWLLTGIGPVNARTGAGYELPGAFKPKAEPAHSREPVAASTLVVVYSMSCVPLEAQGISELEPVGKLALPASLAGPGTLVLWMRDDNMAPVVQRGAYLGVNTADVRLSSGGIFVLKHEYAGMLVRRIFLDYGSNQYLLRSEAGGHPESRMPAEECTGRVVGRVVWVIQEFF
ncbi:MAG: helix-turn-helix domain-containing protein [Betaproteobacteria bacterium]|nr:helix-turn-helix domain-containing protein [Betaproteobacteria bacterium]